MSRKRYFVSSRCTRNCSLNANNIDFAPEALDWYNAGRSITWIITESERMGKKLSTAAVSRHRKHLDVEAEGTDNEAAGNLTHLEVLQLIIKQGAKRAHTWRVGPAETMKAMEMWYRLTQGSALEDLMSALTSTAAGENLVDESDGTVDAGSLSPAELESVDADRE